MMNAGTSASSISTRWPGTRAQASCVAPRVRQARFTRRDVIVTIERGLAEGKAFRELRLPEDGLPSLALDVLRGVARAFFDVPLFLSAFGAGFLVALLTGSLGRSRIFPAGLLDVARILSVVAPFLPFRL